MDFDLICLTSSPVAVNSFEIPFPKRFEVGETVSKPVSIGSLGTNSV